MEVFNSRYSRNRNLIEITMAQDQDQDKCLSCIRLGSLLPCHLLSPARASGLKLRIDLASISGFIVLRTVRQTH